MKRYFYTINFFLTAIFFFVALVLDLKPSIQGFSFVIFCSSIGVLIGDYLRIRKNIILPVAGKKLISWILFISIVFILLILFLIDNILTKQILIFCTLLTGALITIFIVFFKGRPLKKDEQGKDRIHSSSR
jgi:hypothetical protein